jgi:23S rRNA pseudouridine2604 synthase
MNPVDPLVKRRLAAVPKPQPSVGAAPAEQGLVRISKLMSERGMCSRREADDLIEKGLVYLDGQRVTELGTRALPTAQIKIDKKANRYPKATVLIHKPIGLVSGQAEAGYKPAITLVEPQNQWAEDASGMRFHPAHRNGLAVAGRLDIDSTGLLVLTQDGVIAKRLIGEDSGVEKEYLVRVEGRLSDQDMALLNHGMTLDGKALKPAQVSWQNEDQLRFILQEGKKRQIRRMCEMVGLRVTGLKRVRIGRVKLGNLPLGQWRYLGDDEAF